MVALYSIVEIPFVQCLSPAFLRLFLKEGSFTLLINNWRFIYILDNSDIGNRLRFESELER